MKCIIIDDEAEAINVLKRYVTHVPYLEMVHTFRNPLLAIPFLHQTKIDLMFLDINMPDMSGISFLKQIDNKPMVIFTTAYSEYAVESYEVNAIDYLVKPIVFERFIKATNKACQLFSKDISGEEPSKQSEFILLKSGTQVHKIKLSDIIFIEKQDNYLSFQTKERKILVRGNMSDVFEIVPDNLFIRTHKSYIVSLQHIKTIEQYQITVGEYKIPISEMYKEDVWNKLKLS